MPRPHRSSRFARRSALAGLTLAALLCGAGAANAGAAGFGPPSWQDSGAAFAPRPVRAEPNRVVLLAPKPAARVAPAAAAAVPVRQAAVSLAWVNRGGLAVHPRRTRRVDVARLPALPALPPVPAVAEAAPAPASAFAPLLPPARTPLVAVKPGRARAARTIAAAPAGPAPVLAAPGGSALERFLRATAPGTWAGADVRRTAAGPAGGTGAVR